MCHTGDDQSGRAAGPPGVSGLALVRAGLAELVKADVVGLPDARLREEILQLLACANQLSAALADRVGSFDTRELAKADGLRSTQTWLAGFGCMSKGAAIGWLSRARLLRKLPALAEGMRSGSINSEHLELVGKLAWHVGVDAVRPFDSQLAELAAAAGPQQVGQACQRILALVDPDGAEPDPARDWERRELTFARCGTMFYVRGRLDPEGAAVLQTAVDALMRPASPADGCTTAQRRADAVVELGRRAMAAGTLPTVGGALPHVAVLVTPQQLLDAPEHEPVGCHHKGVAASGPAATAGADATQPPQEPDTTVRHGRPTSPGGTKAENGCSCDPLTKAGVPPTRDRPWLSWLGEVSPALAQRLACDAVVWRLVMDPSSGLPLELGREHRLVPHWLRRALHARDRTCRWPGCDTLAAWTDAHHEIPWYEGGTTDIDHLISFCRYHHGLVHEGRWTARLDHPTGEVWVTRPDGTPYELGPSRPFTSPSRQGSPPPGTGRAAPTPRVVSSAA